MSEKLVHRGPDAEGEIHLDYVSMAHRRLSIVDVKNGHQPMVDPILGLHLVFNGEIYNHKELAVELIAKGHHFSTQSDTEVVLKGFAQWGTSLFEKLDGMFAIVIWDANKGALTAARDRYGIKPLYKSILPDGCIVYASELKAISSIKGHSSFNAQSVENYLTLGFFVEEKTFIDDVNQLPIGTYETHRVGDESSSSFRFWSTADSIGNEKNKNISDEDGLEMLHKAVYSQSMADSGVDVGCFLSGGLDSSVISTILAKQSKGSVHSYTAGFNAKEFDESPVAESLANSLGNMHTTRRMGKESLFDLSRLNDIYSGPFADSAALPTFYISKLASEDVKVLLSGDGADELFFGYRNHKSMLFESKLRGCMPRFFEQNVLPWLASAYPNSPSMPRFIRAKSTLEALSKSLSHAYCQAMSITSRKVLESLYTENFKSSLQGFRTEDDFSNVASMVESDDPMKIIQHIDFNTYLPGSLLTKTDRATMMNGVEARLPFLSNQLVDAVLPLKSSENLSFRKDKALLRRWASPILDKNVSSREKKSFTTPFDLWFRALPLEQLCSIIMRESLFDCDIIQKGALRKLVEEHHYGRADHGVTLLSIKLLADSLSQDGEFNNKESYENLISPQDRI